jgi:hypothetical protein
MLCYVNYNYVTFRALDLVSTNTTQILRTVWRQMPYKFLKDAWTPYFKSTLESCYTEVFVTQAFKWCHTTKCCSQAYGITAFHFYRPFNSAFKKPWFTFWCPGKHQVMTAGILGQDLNPGHSCYKFGMSCIHISAPDISHPGVTQSLPQLFHKNDRTILQIRPHHTLSTLFQAIIH